MNRSRRTFIFKSAAAAATLALWQAAGRETEAAAAPEPFQPSWESLANYKCPEWFRDAKFGIWAHWSAQCVPEQGDWYARGMYQQHNAESWSQSQYQYHVDHYGPQSKVGFKDIDHLWHAESWDPDYLIGLYKAAGAKYFVALANHHDNFDTWNSKYQPWNSVAIGPKKDIIGGWAKVARKNGLRFGVTVHAGRTWSWFDVAHGSDTTGPLAGVPYDGNLTKADGAGTWWEGLDPADLYGPAGAARTDAAEKAYERKLYNRVTDLLDQHHPDLVYFDDGEPPTVYGLEIVANYYNASRRWNKGALEAVLNVKSETDRVKKAMVLDYERGQSDRIADQPWQTDTCIGSWHYQRSIYDTHSYKTVRQVVQMLVDIVSKNGNLLLSIPLRGDGTLDPDELKFLKGMAAWMSVNEEAIFATRPWTLYGEGLIKAKAGGFSEGERRYSAHDFRFTTKGKTLYATALNWPDNGRFTVRTLASNAPGIAGKVTSVVLLGSPEKLAWTQTADGLVVTAPAQKPCDHAFVLKIEGIDLAASTPSPPPPVPPTPIEAAADGTFTLPADTADLLGTLHVQDGTQTNIGFWGNSADTASWKVRFDVPGTYAVTAQTAAGDAATTLAIDAGAGISTMLSVPDTHDWNAFRTISGGTLTVPAGVRVITARPADPATWHAVNLASVILRKVS